MSDTVLRNRLIRLAHANPSVRPAILPLLRTAAEHGPGSVWKTDSGNWRAVNDKGEAKSFGEDQDAAKAHAGKAEGGGKKDEKKPKRQRRNLPNPPNRFKGDELSLPKQASQPKVDSKESLLAAAAQAHEQQLDWLNRGKGIEKTIGAEVVRCDKPPKCEVDYDKKGPVIVIGPLKGDPRLSEKAQADYGGDWSKMTDVVRASVALDSMDDIDDVLDKLRKSGMKLAKKPKDRFAEPTDSGYRDMLMNVEYPDGHIGELQIHLKPIMRAKKAGHEAYETVRSIGAKAKEEGRVKKNAKGDEEAALTDEEQAIVDEKTAEMQDLYDAAYEEALGPKSKTAGLTATRMRRVAKEGEIRYYDYDGHPSILEHKKFPVMVNPQGKRVILYDIAKFLTVAHQIEEAEYNKEVSELTKPVKGDADEKGKGKGKDEKGKGKGKKASDLRTRLIRLAAAKPELRADLLPLLQEQADPASADQNKPESYYGLPPRGVQAARRREDPNRVVFKVSRQVDTGEFTVHNLTGGNKYVLSAYGSDPQELAETLESSASASLRFQNMDTLDGPELNVVKAPRFPRNLAERIIAQATVIVGAHYVALQGGSMGLQWVLLPHAPKFA